MLDLFIIRWIIFDPLCPFGKPVCKNTQSRQATLLLQTCPSTLRPRLRYPGRTSRKRVGKYYHPHWSILIPTRWSVLVVSNEPAMCNPLQSQTNRNLSIVHGSMDISTAMNYSTRPRANSCQYHECQHRSGNALLTCEVGGL